MSGLLSTRRAAPPRHSLRTSQPRRRQRLIGIRRMVGLAKGAGLVLVAVVVLFSAVFLLLTVTSWAADRDTSSSTSTGF